MEIVPLFAKVFCINSLDIDEEYWNKLQLAVKNIQYKKADFQSDKSSLVNQDFKILDKPEFKPLGDIILKEFTKFSRQKLKISNNFPPPFFAIYNI